MGHDLNRIKVVLAERHRSNKWLAEQVGKDTSTVSKWCTNAAQPRLDTLKRIADVLDVDIRMLLNPTRDDKEYTYIDKEYTYIEVVTKPRIKINKEND